MKTRLNRVLIHVKIIVLLLSISDTSLAQFDSTIWSNYYSNHSVSSRDNVFSVNLNDKDELLITGRVENDFSNFDISNILLNNNLDLVWKNNYSTDEADISDDHPSDVVYDSAGNIYVTGFRNHYWTSAVCYPYPVFYKLDSKGKHLWSYLFEDFAGNDHPFEAYFLDIECDKSGNCYLLAEGWQPGLTPNARTFIMKFDQEGRRIWCKKTLLYDVKKLLVDNNQDIFVINNDDEDQNRETIIQKYSESGELISEHRYSNYNFDHFDAKIDKNNSLWIFSDINTQGHVDKYASDILISHYDNEGSLLGQKIYKSQFQDYVSLKQVSFYNDSTFLIGIDSNSPENGLDNLLILVNNNLQVVDSFRYDSEWHDNDYLISFDVADDSSVIVTGISFIDYNYFFPYVSKIDHFKHIDWINIPSIADSIETFPKKVFSGSDGTIFLVGDVSMTINPECGYYTHSNYFVTKFDNAGNEILTTEFSESGKSFIVGKKARLDKHNNIYVSGYDQYGPDYIYPISYYREGIILQKYSGDGILKWNTKIPMPKTKIDYINHFITSDSLITVIGGYSGVPYGFSLLYNIDSNGLVLDSAKYDWKVLSAVRDKDGNFYLFFLVDQNIQIIKCDTKLEILKSASVPRNDCFDFITSCENGLIYLLCRDSRYLYKLDSELNLKGQIILSSYFNYVDSFLVDELDNIYLAGRKDSGILIKLNQAGERLWNCKVEKLYSVDRGMDRLSTGDLVLFGSENPVVGSNPSGIALISQDGALKKYITIDCLISNHLVGDNDCIYIFNNRNLFGSKSMYQKYSPNLDLLLSNCFNKQNSFIYTFDFNDVLFDSGSNIIMVGTVGNNMAWMNGMFTWYTLAVTKAGKVNSNPVFVNKDLKKKVLPGDTAILNSPAIDYDNDSITYEIVTPYSWIESYNIPGSFLISPSVSDTGHYQIFLRALDKNNGSDTNIVSLIIGNKPPQIISTPDTLVLLNTNYAYKLIAKDPDDEITFYRISDGPSWLKIDSSGVLSGKPMQQSDTGFYEIKVVAYDEYNGEDMQTYLLHVKSDNSNGIDEIKQRDENILVYPVPSRNFLYLRLTTSIVIKAKIKILSLSGTLIREYQIKEVNDKEILQLEISDINPGIYMLLVTYDGSFLLKKIIIL